VKDGRHQLGVERPEQTGSEQDAGEDLAGHVGLPQPSRDPHDHPRRHEDHHQLYEQAQHQRLCSSRDRGTGRSFERETREKHGANIPANGSRVDLQTGPRRAGHLDGRPARSAARSANNARPSPARTRPPWAQGRGPRGEAHGRARRNEARGVFEFILADAPPRLQKTPPWLMKLLGSCWSTAIARIGRCWVSSNKTSANGTKLRGSTAVAKTTANRWQRPAHVRREKRQQSSHPGNGAARGDTPTAPAYRRGARRRGPWPRRASLASVPSPLGGLVAVGVGRLELDEAARAPARAAASAHRIAAPDHRASRADPSATRRAQRTPLRPVHLGDALVARDTPAGARRAGPVAGDQVRVVDERAGHRHQFEPLPAGRVEVLERGDPSEQHERQAHRPPDLAGERQEVHRLERVGADDERPEQRQRQLLRDAALGRDHGAQRAFAAEQVERVAADEPARQHQRVGPHGPPATARAGRCPPARTRRGDRRAG
jgi:hypothetical protein